MVKPNYVGIDVAKDSMEVAAHESNGHWTFSNDERGLTNLISKMKRLSRCLIVMEATGGYEVTAAVELRSRGFPVAVVNPRHVRDFVRSVGILAKIDVMDAKVIARYAATVQPTPRALPAEETKKLGGIMMLEQELNDINKELKQIIESNPEWKEKGDIIQSVPGVGPNLAITILSDFPELGQLNRKQTAALSGVVPFNRDSVTMRRKRCIW